MSTVLRGKKKRMYNSTRERDYKGFYNGGIQMEKQIWSTVKQEKETVETKNEREQQRQGRIREIRASWVTIQQQVSFCFAFYIFI